MVTRMGSRLLTALVGMAAVGLGLGASSAPLLATSTAASGIAPGPTSMMDCNGYSKQYPSPVPGMKMRCVDPIGEKYDGRSGRFYDNGHYVGHDEPSTKFISTVPGSGNTFTIIQQLSSDPSSSLTRTTTPTGTTVSDYAVLSPAPWVGLPICDSNSFPNGACTPDSDTNNPNTAGSAFMELQFYPPKYGPWLDNVSMDLTKWTVALNIDSLECPGTSATGCVTPNPNCTEPVNFALLTHDGVPTGPPGPESATGHTFAENSDTLLMNPGDTTEIRITDVPDSGSPSVGGLRAEVDDLTTGERGFIVASAHNGFETTNEASCSGTAQSFHAEYSTASQANQVPWAALEGGLLLEHEIGHSEPCASLSSADAQSNSADGFSDPNVMAVCHGGFEAENGASGTGEGPCATGQPTSGNCTGATTEGSSATACPVGGGLCEQSDGFCIPAGPRHVTVNSADEIWNQPIDSCQQNQTQNGDLDFDGTPYIHDWPDGSADHPTSFRYLGPFDPNGNSYPKVQFETDAPGSENDCNPSAPTASTCKVPPAGATFYPYWSLTSTQGLSGITTNTATPSCAWNFGDHIASVTTSDLGSDAQYGTASSHYGGTLISAAANNPQVSGSCPSLTLAQVTESDFVPLPPARILDTRLPAKGSCSSSGTAKPCSALGTAQQMDVQVTGTTDVNTGLASGVPLSAGITAVAMNVTAADTTAAGFLTLWPTGTSRPTASNLNFVAGQVAANLTEVPVSSTGKVSVFNHLGTTDVIFDVAGYYTTKPSGTAGFLHSLPPSRIMDTRSGTAGCGGACTTLGQGGTLTLQVAGAPDVTTGEPSGVPADGTAAAVVVNLTVTDSSAGGFLTAYPTGDPRPTTSNVNFVTGQTVPNRAIVALGPGGKITLFNHTGTVDVVIDVGGYYTAATATGIHGGYTAVPPSRIMDTRTSQGSCTSTCATIPSGGSLTLHVAGSSDINTSAASGIPPTGARVPPTAVVLNVTAVNPTSSSFITIYPGGSRPVISDLNVTPGIVIPNLVVVQFSPSGTITIFNQLGSVDIVVDVEGWYSSLCVC